MKKESNRYEYMASALLVLVPATGRFAIGLVLCLGMYFISFFGTLFNGVIKKYAPENSKPIFQFILVILLSAIFKQLVMIYSPVISVYIGFSIYLVALSTIMLNVFFVDDEATVGKSLAVNLRIVSKFTLFTLLFFVLRDYLGYQTITLPVFEGLMEINIPGFPFMKETFFWGSIPLAIIILGLALAALTWYYNRKMIVRRRKGK